MKQQNPIWQTLRQLSRAGCMLALMILPGSFSLVAQPTDSHSSMRIGVRLGAGTNRMSQPLAVPGWHAGGFLRYTLTGFLQVQAELLYHLQGGGQSNYVRSFGPAANTGPDGPIDYVEYINRSVYLHNLELPIIFRLGLPGLNGGTIIPRLIAGGSYSYTVSVAEVNDKIINFTNGTRALVANTKESMTADYYRHNFSIYAGMAIDFRLVNNRELTLEMNFRQGLTNLNKVATTIAELTGSQYATTLGLSLTYQLF